MCKVVAKLALVAASAWVVAVPHHSAVVVLGEL